MFNRYHHHQRQAGRFALVMLLFEVMRIGLDRIPPVTLSVVAIQVLIHLRHMFDVRRWIPLPMSVGDVCVSVLHAWYRDDLRRLILAAFYHVDDIHLYYNMTSMLWKGLRLERRYGTIRFASMVIVFSVLVNVLLVALSLLAEHLTGEGSYITQCSAGFSGVLFALKVIVNDMDPHGTHYVMGIPIPTKLACWAELILIHILVPQSSFLGHLAGILVGIFFTKGPLKKVFDLNFTRSAPSRRLNYAGTSGYGYSQPYASGSTGYAAGAFGADGQEQWTSYSSAMPEPTGSYEDDAAVRNTRQTPSAEELRLRRLQRFAS